MEKFSKAVNTLNRIENVEGYRRGLVNKRIPDDNNIPHVLLPPAPWEALVSISWYPFIKLMLDRSFILTKGTVHKYSEGKVPIYTPHNII